MIKVSDVNRMKDEAVREYLETLIEKLNELDEMDYFGTEGWERMLLDE